MKEAALFDFDDLAESLLCRLDQESLREWLFIEVFEYGVLPLHNVPELEKLWMLARLKSENVIKAKVFAQVFEKADKNKKACPSMEKKLAFRQTLLILSDLAFGTVSLATLQALVLIRSVYRQKELDLPGATYFAKLEQAAVLSRLLQLERTRNQKKRANER